MYGGGSGPKTDVVVWRQSKIPDMNSVIEKQGKNWHVLIDGCVITVNASSYMIIKAHRETKRTGGNEHE